MPLCTTFILCGVIAHHHSQSFPAVSKQMLRTGGVDVPEVLGSRSTDVRGGLGGFDGRMLQEGDSVGRLPSEDVAEADTELLAAVHDPLRTAAGADGKTWKLRCVFSVTVAAV